MIPYNKSRLFKRAHYLVRSRGWSMSEALKYAWNDAKSFRESEAKEAEELAESKKHEAFSCAFFGQSDASSYYSNQPAGAYTGD